MTEINTGQPQTPGEIQSYGTDPTTLQPKVITKHVEHKDSTEKSGDVQSYKLQNMPSNYPKTIPQRQSAGPPGPNLWFSPSAQLAFTIIMMKVAQSMMKQGFTQAQMGIQQIGLTMAIANDIGNFIEKAAQAEANKEFAQGIASITQGVIEVVKGAVQFGAFIHSAGSDFITIKKQKEARVDTAKGKLDSKKQLESDLKTQIKNSYSNIKTRCPNISDDNLYEKDNTGNFKYVDPTNNQPCASTVPGAVKVPKTGQPLEMDTSTSGPKVAEQTEYNSLVKDYNKTLQKHQNAQAETKEADLTHQEAKIDLDAHNKGRWGFASEKSYHKAQPFISVLDAFSKFAQGGAQFASGGFTLEAGYENKLKEIFGAYSEIAKQAMQHYFSEGDKARQGLGDLLQMLTKWADENAKTFDFKG